MNYLVWGTGRISEESYQAYLKLGDWIQDTIIGFLDNNANKWGTVFHDLPVYSPLDIQKIEYDVITIWVKDYEMEIRKQLTKIGIAEEKIKDIFSNYKNALYAKYLYEKDPEIKDALDAIRCTQSLNIYNYIPFNKEKIYQEVLWDEQAQLYYALFEGKRLYLKRTWNSFINIDGKKYVNNLYGEQDLNSPHLYEQGDIVVEKGDVLIDAGACEGNFSLHNIDKVSKLYIVECDPEWMEALKHTFAPYIDKVVFIDKFLSDHDDEACVKIDTFVEGSINFIKMDIEGEEINALKGASEVLRINRNIKCAICAYHRHDDEIKIKGILSEYQFHTNTSEGYMLFYGDSFVLKYPELRKGIVRGTKRTRENHTQNYLDMMNQWLILKQKQIALDQYLFQHGWQKVAIYGMGIYGRHLVRELAKSDLCKIVYGIDQKAMNAYQEIPIFHPEHVSKQADVIINTIIYDKSINEMLQEKFQTNVLDLEDLIFDSYIE